MFPPRISADTCCLMVAERAPNQIISVIITYQIICSFVYPAIRSPGDAYM